MALCRGGDNIGLCCDCMDGDTWGLPATLEEDETRCETAVLLCSGMALDADDEGRGWLVSSGALHDPRLDEDIEAGAVDGPGPFRGDDG